MAKKRVKKAADGGGNGMTHAVLIPPLNQAEFTLLLIGDRPLMVNNKLNVAESIAEQYSGTGKAGAVKSVKPTPEEQYKNAFYEMEDSPQPAPSPKGRYGVPASGIKKCVCSAIRTTGITDNVTIGLIAKSFWVMEDKGGLCEIKGKFKRDKRPVNIGSMAKTSPEIRYRPSWDKGWRIKILVKYNAKVLTPEAIVNLFMHAGQYIGLCEMRAEKKQGACGGFVVRAG